MDSTGAHHDEWHESNSEIHILHVLCFLRILQFSKQKENTIEISICVFLCCSKYNSVKIYFNLVKPMVSMFATIALTASGHTYAVLVKWSNFSSIIVYKCCLRSQDTKFFLLFLRTMIASHGFGDQSVQPNYRAWAQLLSAKGQRQCWSHERWDVYLVM